MTIRVTSATLPAWYEDKIGETFEVEPEPYQYSGGMGYMVIGGGGVLVKDCVVVKREEWEAGK